MCCFPKTAISMLNCTEFIEQRMRPRCNGKDSSLIDGAGLVRAAGLNDHAKVLAKLLSIADWTCSQLYYPPPCEMLDRRHNDGKNVSCEYGWEFYLNIPHPYDNLLLTHEQYAMNKQEPPLDIDILVPPKQIYGWACLGHKFPYGMSYDNTNKHSIEAQTVLKQLLGDRKSEFYGLHVRRTDAVKECDSSVRRVVEKVRNITSPTLRLPLLYWSDEKDQSYHAELYDALMGTLSERLSRVIWLDPVLRNMSAVVNNFHVHAIEIAVGKSATKLIEFRRTFDCR